jgi:hypothetical protein
MDLCLLLSVVCCQVEVSATGWSLVKGSPTECGVSECACEATTRTRATRAVQPLRGGGATSGQCGKSLMGGGGGKNKVNEKIPDPTTQNYRNANFVPQSSAYESDSPPVSISWQCDHYDAILTCAKSGTRKRSAMFRHSTSGPQRRSGGWEEDEQQCWMGRQNTYFQWKKLLLPLHKF